MKDSINFWNEAAEKYAQDPIKDMESYEYKLAKTRAYFEPDMNVLEIACGTGTTALLHAPYVASYHAVDISREMICIAWQKEGADQIKFETADFEKMPIKPENFGMVQAHSVVHLLNDPAATIRKAYSALRHGGTFVRSTACRSGIWPFCLIAPFGQMIGKFPHMAFSSEDGLRTMMQDAGFQIVENWKPNGRFTSLFLICKKSK